MLLSPWWTVGPTAFDSRIVWTHPFQEWSFVVKISRIINHNPLYCYLVEKLNKHITMTYNKPPLSGHLTNNDIVRLHLLDLLHSYMYRDTHSVEKILITTFFYRNVVQTMCVCPCACMCSINIWLRESSQDTAPRRSQWHPGPFHMQGWTWLFLNLRILKLLILLFSCFIPLFFSTCVISSEILSPSPPKTISHAS